MFSRVSLYRSILGGQSNTTGDFKEVYFLHILYILFDIFYLEVNDELDSVSKNGPFAKLCTQIVSTSHDPTMRRFCCLFTVSLFSVQSVLVFINFEICAGLRVL